MNTIDYTGRRFGKLTALSDTGKRRRKYSIWLFRCDCGAVIERHAANIVQSARTGSTPSCLACRTYARVDMTNQRFGKLTAIRPTGEIYRKNIIWEFQCDCGAIVESYPSHINTMLKRGMTPSCGSYECNGRHKNPHAFLDALITKYAKAARERDREFLLTRDECAALFAGNCHYCGQAPSRPFLPGKKDKYRNREPLLFNGIDRVDNEIGYIASNTVSCCWTCNKLKGTMPYSEWMEWLDRVTSFRTRGQYE
jgi:hypothetical protein